MTPHPEQSSGGPTVGASLRIWTPPGARPLKSLNAAVSVVRFADVVRLRVELEGRRTVRELELGEDAAAYLAGALADAAGSALIASKIRDQLADLSYRLPQPPSREVLDAWSDADDALRRLVEALR